MRRTVASGGLGDEPPPRGQVATLRDVAPSSQERTSVGFAGLDRILGTDPLTGNQGIAAKAGQAIQIYGSPGSGKSTLLLQLCFHLARARHAVLYIVGEESMQAVKSRADRIGKVPAKLLTLEETDLDKILYQCDELEPEFLVTDSIQTIGVEDYAQGSPTAMRLAARELYKFTNARGIGLFLITQMNKASDDFAGPKEIEHIVDTSMFLRVDRRGRRVLECNKNRFGQAPASQLYRMTASGLEEAEDEPEPVEPPAGPPHLIVVP